jgi:ubiquinone/menaquinone biosynthesis C-methylase UbiE
VRGNAQSLPYPADLFDQIVATFPSEYLFQPRALAEIHRVLSPDGLLVVLPVAWIGQGSKIDRGLEMVYRVTHQAPARNDEVWRTRITKIFLQAGFDVFTETITIDTSETFILLARVPKLL